MASQEISLFRLLYMCCLPHGRTSRVCSLIHSVCNIVCRTSLRHIIKAMNLKLRGVPNSIRVMPGTNTHDALRHVDDFLCFHECDTHMLNLDDCSSSFPFIEARF